MDTLISIIVPIYNVEDFLDRCVNSLVNQTYKNIEILLVDDGSPDNCPKMCDEWALRDRRIKVFHKKNGGLSDARNHGMRNAQGEYILFVDSDDYLVYDACEQLIACAAGVDIVVGEATIYEPNKTDHQIHTNLKEDHIYTGTEYAKLASIQGQWYAAACFNMYRRDFLIANELFFKVGILHEDIEYLPRLFLAAKTVKYLDYEFYCYVIRENSICGTKSEKHLNDLLNTYGEWKALNDTIIDPETKRYYAGALSKYYITTCRKFRYAHNVMPKGITKKYLLFNALNLKELIKTLAFIFFRSYYVKL